MTALSIIGLYLLGWESVSLGGRLLCPCNSQVSGQPEPSICGARSNDYLTGALLLQLESLVPGRVNPVICNRHCGCVRRSCAQPPEAEAESVPSGIGFARHGHVSLLQHPLVPGRAPRHSFIRGGLSGRLPATRRKVASEEVFERSHGIPPGSGRPAKFLIDDPVDTIVSDDGYHKRGCERDGAKRKRKPVQLFICCLLHSHTSI